MKITSYFTMRKARFAAVWLAALAAGAGVAAAAPPPVESPKAARPNTGVPALTFSPAVMDFGTVTIGQDHGPKAMTLTNSGTATLDLTYIHLEGADRGNFGIETNTCGATLAPGASCSLGILASALYKGPEWAFVYVESNSPNSPQTAEVVAYGIN